MNDKCKIIKIAEDYLVFEVGSVKYMTDIINLLDYIKYDYLPDCVVGDVNDLFEAIIEIAKNKDMFSLIELFKHIEEKELGHDYLILYSDCTIDCFSNVLGLSCLINIEDLINYMISEELVENYCKRIE